MQNSLRRTSGPLVLLVLAIMAIAAWIVWPRLLDAQSPAFEVASVKPNQSGDGVSFLRFSPGGRFTATNFPLRNLIRFAYDVRDFQLLGGPSWIAGESVDIVAKAEGEPSRDQLLLMIRTLLADRFRLVLHMETRDLPIYALVLARSDGKLGPQLQRSAIDCAALARGRANQPLPPGPPPPPPPPGELPTCAAAGGVGNMAGGGVPFSTLVGALSNRVNRLVLDRTGLTGFFDYRLTWTPDQLPPALGGPPGAPQPPPIDPNGPSIFAAVQEQLGLKLESDRGPVEVLVIDRVEQLTEN